MACLATSRTKDVTEDVHSGSCRRCCSHDQGRLHRRCHLWLPRCRHLRCTAARLHSGCPAPSAQHHAGGLTLSSVLVVVLLVVVVLPLQLLLFRLQLLHALEEGVLRHLLALVAGPVVHREGNLDHLQVTTPAPPALLTPWEPQTCSKLAYSFAGLSSFISIK